MSYPARAEGLGKYDNEHERISMALLYKNIAVTTLFLDRVETGVSVKKTGRRNRLKDLDITILAFS